MRGVSAWTRVRVECRPLALPQRGRGNLRPQMSALAMSMPAGAVKARMIGKNAHVASRRLHRK